MLLAIEDIQVCYGDIQVLWKVSLEMQKEEVVALVGSNGSGKSTLLRTISGLIPLKDGKIYFNNEDISALHPRARVQMGITHIPEGRQLFAGMTVKENIMMGAYTRKNTKEIKEDYGGVINLFPELVSRQNRQAGVLSGGEQQMIAIARGLMSKPKLLLIDELSLGLAPLVVLRLVELLKKIHQEMKIGILFVEQNVQMACEMAERGYVLELGKVVLHGESHNILNDEKVKVAYLGI